MSSLTSCGPQRDGRALSGELHAAQPSPGRVAGPAAQALPPARGHHHGRQRPLGPEAGPAPLAGPRRGRGGAARHHPRHATIGASRRCPSTPFPRRTGRGPQDEVDALMEPLLQRNFASGNRRAGRKRTCASAFWATWTGLPAPQRDGGGRAPWRAPGTIRGSCSTSRSTTAARPELLRAARSDWREQAAAGEMDRRTILRSRQFDAAAVHQRASPTWICSSAPAAKCAPVQFSAVADALTQRWCLIHMLLARLRPRGLSARTCGSARMRRPPVWRRLKKNSELKTADRSDGKLGDGDALMLAADHRSCCLAVRHASSMWVLAGGGRCAWVLAR